MTKEPIVLLISKVLDLEIKNKTNTIIARLKPEKEMKIFLDENYPNLATKEQCWLLYHDRTREEFKCKQCNGAVVFRKWNVGYNIFCNHICGSLWQSHNIGNPLSAYAKAKALPILTKTCITCKKEFETKLKKRIACSQSCGQIYNNHIRTDEHKAEIQERREETCLKKYGNKHHIASDIIRDKIEQKTGFRYTYQDPTVLEGIKNRYMEKYGVDNPMKRPEIQAKMVATRIEKYGDLLIPCYNYKIYTLPSGKQEYVQGYENRALDILLQTYKEEDLLIGRKMTRVTGPFKYFQEERERYYYPDIFIISENKVIEVKSNYTYEKQKNTNLLKRDSVLKKGYEFEFMIL